MWNQEDVENRLMQVQEELAKLSLSNSRTGLPKPQFFDGGASFEQYLRNFNRIATAHAWPPERCVQILPLYLAGTARAIYDGLAREQKTTWKTLVDTLAEKLSKRTTKESARRQLSTRKQKPNESFHEFAIAIKDLVEKAFPKSVIPGNPSDEEAAAFRDEIARDYFRLGLSQEIKEKVLYMDIPNSLEAAIEQAKSVLEIRESLQQEAAINSLQAETKQVLESVKEEICSIRRDIDNKKRAGQGNSNLQYGRYDNRNWQPQQRQDYGQNFQNQRGRGRGRRNFQQNYYQNRYQANQNQQYPSNQGQGQNYSPYQNNRPNYGQQNPGPGQAQNSNYEPIQNPRWINRVANPAGRSRSPSPIFMPFLAISLILFVNTIDANPTFQICPKNTGSWMEMPVERNCTIPNSDTFQNKSVIIFLPKRKLKPFPIYKCWRIVTTICTVHYAVYFHQKVPQNLTVAPPNSKECNEFVWDKKMVQLKENVWWTAKEFKYNYAVVGSECKNTTNEYIAKGQATTIGDKVVMNWGGSFPFNFAGSRTEQTKNETFIWNNGAKEFWESHQQQGPEEAVIINDQIFIVESLQYAFIKHEKQSFEGTKGVPNNAIRAENGAFLQIQNPSRFKRKIPLEPKQPREKEKLQPRLKERPTKRPANLRENVQSTTSQTNVPMTPTFQATTPMTTTTILTTTKKVESPQTTTIPPTTTVFHSTKGHESTSPASLTAAVTKASTFPQTTRTTSTKTAPSTLPSTTTMGWQTSPLTTVTQTLPRTTTLSTIKSSSVPTSTLIAKTMPISTTKVLEKKVASIVTEIPVSSSTILSVATTENPEIVQMRSRILLLESLMTTTEQTTTEAIQETTDDPEKKALAQALAHLESRLAEIEKVKDESTNSVTQTLQTSSPLTSTTTVKRSIRQNEEIYEAHTNSKLNYLSLKQKQNAEMSERELWANQCHLQNQHIRLIKSIALEDPASAARNLYGRRDITATLDKINPNRWQLTLCTPIQADEIIWSRQVDGICYDNLPVKVGKSTFFVRPGTNDLQNSAKNISCDDEQEFSPGNQTEALEGLEQNQLQSPTKKEYIIFTKGTQREETDLIEESIEEFRSKWGTQETPSHIFSLNPEEAIQSLLAGGGEKINEIISSVGKVASEVAENVGEKAIETAEKIGEEAKNAKDIVVKKAEEASATWNWLTSAWETAKWLLPTILISIGVLVLLILVWKFRAWFSLIFTVLQLLGRGIRAAFLLFGPRRNRKPKYIAPVRRTKPSAPTEAMLEEEAYVLDYVPRVNAIGNNQSHIHVNLNGHPVRALFDSGAELTYGRQTVMLRCGLNIQNGFRLPTARAANDTIIEFLGKAEAMFEIGSFSASHNLLVSLDEDCPEEIIIGTDLMTKINRSGHQIGLDFMNREVQIGVERCPMIAEVQREQKKPLADSNLEESDSQESVAPRLGKVWQATIPGGGETDSDWEEITARVQISAICADENRSFNGFTKWNNLLDGEETEVLVNILEDENLGLEKGEEKKKNISRMPMAALEKRKQGHRDNKSATRSSTTVESPRARPNINFLQRLQSSAVLSQQERPYIPVEEIGLIGGVLGVSGLPPPQGGADHTPKQQQIVPMSKNALAPPPPPKIDSIRSFLERLLGRMPAHHFGRIISTTKFWNPKIHGSKLHYASSSGPQRTLRSTGCGGCLPGPNQIDG